MKKIHALGLYDKEFLQKFSELAKNESENKSNALIYSMDKRFRYDLFIRKQAEEDENEHRENSD